MDRRKRKRKKKRKRKEREEKEERKERGLQASFLSVDLSFVLTVPLVLEYFLF